MAEPITTLGVIKAIGEAVAGYAFGKAGDKFFDTFSAKWKIKKILKDDKKFIEGQFKDIEYELRSVVEEFLFTEIFQDSMFLYPVTNIPDDRATLLWERWERFRNKTTDKYEWPVFDDEIKIKLEACINNHNELVNKNLLSESEGIILKTIHRNQSDLLGYIGKTLDANTELQFQDSKLDYTHKQIEGILHALRMDMRHYKFLLFLYSIGILIIELAAIIMLPKIIAALQYSVAEQSVVVFNSIIFIVACLFMLLLGLFTSTLMNVKNCEKRISTHMETLWELHFRSYRILFEDSFKRH